MAPGTRRAGPLHLENVPIPFEGKRGLSTMTIEALIVSSYSPIVVERRDEEMKQSSCDGPNPHNAPPRGLNENASPGGGDKPENDPHQERSLDERRMIAI